MIDQVMLYRLEISKMSSEQHKFITMLKDDT